MDFADLDFSEKMISTLPVMVRRRVKFGECDPAGVVYTPIFSEYALSAYQWFLQAMLGEPMFAAMKRIGFDSPIKALTFEFRNMLVIEQVFDMTCRVTDIRTRTFDVEITGRSTTEKPHDIYVIASITPIMLSRSERRSIEIPAELRQKLEAYRSSAIGSRRRRCGLAGFRLIGGQKIRIDPAQPFQVHLAGAHHVAEGEFQRRQMLARIGGLVPEDRCASRHPESRRPWVAARARIRRGSLRHRRRLR